MLLERDRTEDSSSASRADDDSTQRNAAPDRSISEDNSKSESGPPEVRFNY